MQGEAPHGLQAIGAVIAVSAVVLVAREPDPEWREASRESIGLAALAALGFGTFFLLLDGVAAHDPAWAIAAARTGGVDAARRRGAVDAAGIAAGARRRCSRRCWRSASSTCSRTRSTPSRRRRGSCRVVAVAASLYSAVTVLLARFVLGERLAPAQRAGIVAALAGMALIAAGS